MITCTFENKGKGNLRHVVVNAIILKENNILLVKRAKKLTEGEKWGLVGGFMERDETLEEGLVREVFEEVGYRLKKVSFFTVIDNPNRKGSDWQNINFIYICEAGKKEGKADWESTEQKWFDLDNLPREEEIAFDHLEIINLYLKHKNTSFPKLVNY